MSIPLTRPFVLLATLAAAVVVPISASPASAAPSCGGKRATIVGTAKADVLRGTRGNDVIVGLGGRDRIEGRGGSDLICGGGGNDVIRTHASGSSQVWGGGGNDRIVGLGDFEVLRGGGGHDTLRATGDRPRLLGGAGDDVITGGPDRDDIDAGPGDDRVFGGPGADRIRGGLGNDRIEGGTGPNVIAGDDGDDQLYGGPDPDVLDGGPGNDALHAGAGNDASVIGGDGDDELHGDDGDDRLSAGNGVDVCTGGAGTDFCDGGSPGGPENTPGDPDLCTSDVEHKTSCRDVAAVRSDYLVTIEGSTDRVTVEGETTVTWRIEAPVTLIVSTAGRHLFGSTAATGSYEIEGDVGACTTSESGTFGSEDAAVRLWLPESGAGTWDWSWDGPAWFPATWRCAGGSEWPQSVGAYLEDEAGGLPYAPDAGGAWRGSGSTEPAEGVTVTYSYAITPLVS